MSSILNARVRRLHDARVALWLGIVGTSFAMTSISLTLSGCLRQRDSQLAVAIVHEAPIFLDEFKRMWLRVRLETDDVGQPPAESIEAQKRALLNDIINRRLLVAEAEKHNVVVPNVEIDTALKGIKNGWNEEFSATLQSRDLTMGELRDELRQMLMVRRYMRDYVFARVVVTDQDIETYLKSHPEALLQDEEIHVRQIACASQEKAQQAAVELKAGAKFEDVAMKYSVTGDGIKGGDLGTFKRGVMPKIIDDTCFSLPLNKISDVVASAYGFHLFKVIERHPQRSLTVAEVRDGIEAKLRRDKERDAQAQTLRDLWDSGAVSIKEERLAQVL